MIDQELLDATLLLDKNRVDFQQAIRYQKQWCERIQTVDSDSLFTTVAGVDIAYDEKTNQAYAVAVLLDANSLDLLEIQTVQSEIAFPYRTGLLSFREVPALAKALNKLSVKPDLIVCDGQGLAHPRRFGLACHLGLAYNIPTIGCGKTRLYGNATIPGEERGDRSYIYDAKANIIGCVLRTRKGIKPVYVSVGHKISLATACDWILKLSPKYRLPETTRHADRLSKVFKRGEFRAYA